MVFDEWLKEHNVIDNAFERMKEYFKRVGIITSPTQFAFLETISLSLW